MKKIISIILMFILPLLLLTACWDDDFAPEEKAKIEIVSELDGKYEHLYGDYYTMDISGIAKNVSGKKLSYVMLTFSVSDADGNQIGTAIDNILDLEAGATWKFIAFGTFSDCPDTYKLTSISAY